MPEAPTRNAVLARAISACLAWERSEPASFRSDLAVGQLAAAARDHRVVPLVARWRERLNLDPSDAEVLAQGAVQNAQKALASAQLLRRFLGELDGVGISALVLKGLPLALRTTGDLGGRHCGDVDLFVRQRDLEPVAAVLDRLGGRPRQMLPSVDHRIHRRWVLWVGNHVSHDLPEGHVEVHWELAKFGFVPITFEEAWATRTSVAIGDATVPTLGPAEELVFVVAHGAKHHYARLQWLVDVARLLAGATDDVRAEALDLARRSGLTVPYAASLQLAARIAPIPPYDRELSTSERRRVDRTAREMWASCLMGQEPTGLVRLTTDLGLRRGASYRVRVLAGTAVPAEMVEGDWSSLLGLPFRKLRRR